MEFAQVPGVVIHHSPASSGCYVGCPSVAILPDGTYVASHSHFGPGSSNSRTWVYRSADEGRTWEPAAELEGQIWSNLFVHQGDLYLMGTDHCDRSHGRLNGRMVIRRSTDGGRGWSVPQDEESGLLSDYDGYHTAPVPVVVHRGRIWRAMEYAPVPERLHWRALVLSAPVQADLLRRDSWSCSEMLAHPASRSQWIEGNMVVDPSGQLVDLLRTNYAGDPGVDAVGFVDRVALIRVSEDGRHLVHRPETDVFSFPGGGSKFTIRWDEISQRYWALANKQLDPPAQRNRLYLISSPDLRRWNTEQQVLHHEREADHAFQYVDWVFAGRDLVFVSRTAYHDGAEPAHNFHDANFLTFHRVKDFRRHLSV